MTAAWRILIVVATLAGCGPSDRAAIDAAPPADSKTADSAQRAAFGEPCTKHVDCTDGYCVEPAGGVGGQCSRTCHNDCPIGWDCMSVEFPQSNVDLCVPANGRLCAPCIDDGECPGGACLTIDGERRCGTTCASSATCTTGYTCAPEAAHGGMFCQPQTSSCSCTGGMVGAQRSCTTSNAIGTCFGTESCTTSGWTTCTARIAAAEACDGIDNDCDFVIDDGVGGGQACMNTNANGSCAGVRTCDGMNGFVCNGPVPKVEQCNSIDDNCNGAVDEGFPGLGTLCSAGVGGCLRYGSLRCDGSGTGLVCGAVPGQPVTELCNQIDDNCNGQTDELFPTLGSSCSAGIGACQRFGTVVCSTNQLSAQCNATAGPPAGADTCNYIDDDCNGTVDDAFRNASGTYFTTQNCGACGIDCGNAFPGAANAISACVVNGTSAGCGLSCTSGAFNLNNSISDGCEFFLDTTAIYVSANDGTAMDDAGCGLGPAGTGAGNHPCRTIAFGITRAASTSRANILVADAAYNEGVTIPAGKNLLGGYRADTWERHLATTSTVIQGFTMIGSHQATVVANSITTPTVFEGFVVRGSLNTRAGGNSYAVYISNSSASLVLRNNQLFGGRGGPGTVGFSASNGSSGTRGGPYSGALYDAFQATGAGACNPANNRARYGGGLKTCDDGNQVNGGDGGGVNCTPALSTQNSTAGSPAFNGLAGAGPGGGQQGFPGTRGYDAEYIGNSCRVPTDAITQAVLPQAGNDGVIGQPGQPAPPVGGCAAAGGSVVFGHWVGGAAPQGNTGYNGGGGGGGGAGGGSACTNCNQGDMMHALLGGHGGGGGSGGCGGTGGGGGGSGGGAFVLFVVDGAPPMLTSNEITLGIGGTGGSGGTAGAGGLGGVGGAGGTAAALFCVGKGGRGANGGSGGSGSGGGGGCGGGSYGIFTWNIGSPGYCASNTVGGGTAGAGGPGGASSGSPGGTGGGGVLSSCTSF